MDRIGRGLSREGSWSGLCAEAEALATRVFFAPAVHLLRLLSAEGWANWERKFSLRIGSGLFFLYLSNWTFFCRIFFLPPNKLKLINYHSSIYISKLITHTDWGHARISIDSQTSVRTDCFFVATKKYRTLRGKQEIDWRVGMLTKLTGEWVISFLALVATKKLRNSGCSLQNSSFVCFFHVNWILFYF